MIPADVSVLLWGENSVHAFVTVNLSAQSAANVLAVMKQSCTGSCDGALDQSAFNELMRQLSTLNLPEPARL